MCTAFKKKRRDRRAYTLELFKSSFSCVYARASATIASRFVRFANSFGEKIFESARAMTRVDRRVTVRVRRATLQLDDSNKKIPDVKVYTFQSRAKVLGREKKMQSDPNDVCMVCLDEQEADAKRYTRCCEKMICARCVSRLASRAHAGCPNCRSTLGNVWVSVDIFLFDAVRLNRDGHHNAVKIPERVRRRYLRAARSCRNETFDAFIERIYEEARLCLAPFIDDLLSDVPCETYFWCFEYIGYIG